MRAIFKREMRAYFASPVGYVVVAALLALYGFFYYQVMAIGSSSYITQVFSTMFMFSMMIMPIITMRSMSDDRKNKTDQALITAPVSVTGIVMGKFLAAFGVYFIANTLALLPAITMSFFSSAFPWGILFGNYIGTLLYGAAMISIGVFISGLTISQVIAAIGTFVGIVPATGGGIAAFLAYNEARRASKHPEMFGEGAYEGLFAAETANNGVTGGALVPLLTLGIPGDTITAVLMGALTIQGLTPGPMLFQNNPEVITGIYTMLLICNIFMIILGLAGTRLFMHVIKIPNDVLLPCVMLLCFIGSFASGNKIFDVGTAVVMGIIGFLFTLGEIPAAPCLLGIILGSTVETNFRRAMVISNGSYSIFVQKPICLVFLLISLASILFVAFRDVLPGKKKTVKDA